MVRSGRGPMPASAATPILFLLSERSRKERRMVSGEEFKTAIFLNPIKCNGRVAEWLKAPDSKSGVAATLPWVRIPPLPPVRGKTRFDPRPAQLCSPRNQALLKIYRQSNRLVRPARAGSRSSNPVLVDVNWSGDSSAGFPGVDSAPLCSYDGEVLQTFATKAIGTKATDISLGREYNYVLLPLSPAANVAALVRDHCHA